jgi:hypothetical protein
MRHLFALTLLAAAAIFGGCNQPGAGAKGNIASPQEAKTLLTAALDSRRTASCIIAGGDMKIHDRDSDFSLGVQIENLAAVYPDKMRMKTTKLAGAVAAFDLLMRDNKIAFYVPRQNTLYMGNVSDLQGGGINFSPELLLARLLRGSDKLREFDWTVTAPDGKNRETVIEQAHPAGAKFLRVNLDTRREMPTITKITYYTEQNTPYLVEEYGDYREFPTPLAPEKKMFFPTHFALIWPEHDRYVRMGLKNIQLNRRPEELAEAFSGIDDLDPDRVTRKELRQARIEGDAAAAGGKP